MLNMALLNIMNSSGKLGGGDFEDTSDFNIFGLMCPAIYSNDIHFPGTIHIWNRFLTNIFFNFRCEVKGGSAAAHVITSVGAAPIVGKDNQDFYNTPWMNTEGRVEVNPTGVFLSSKNNYFGERGMLFNSHDYGDFYKFWENFIEKPTERERLVPTQLGVGYSNYYDYLPPLPGQLDLNVSSRLADAVGGHVWMCGALPFIQTTMYSGSIYRPVQRFTKGIVNEYWDLLSDWQQIVVPIRGLTNCPAFENANQMMYGYAQIESPQIGYGEAYTFGVAKSRNCLPTATSVWKCGKQFSQNSAYPNVTRDYYYAKQLFPGFAAFNLDDFLRPFKQAGHLNTLADGATIFNKLVAGYYQGGYTAGSPQDFSHSVRSYFTRDSPWDGLGDGWNEYAQILKTIGANPQYYWNALQREYPTECNFHSILGCGSSFNAGIEFNSAVCAINDAMSVFNAMRLYPDTFPVDISRL